MNQLSKTKKKRNSGNKFIKIVKFLCTHGLVSTGILMLIVYIITGNISPLVVAGILSISILGLIFILSIQALYIFGLDALYGEIEVNFFILTLYSCFLTLTLCFLFKELFLDRLF